MSLRFRVSVLSILWHFPAQSGDVQANLTNDTSTLWASIFTIFKCSSRCPVPMGGTNAQGLELSWKCFKMSESML